MSLSRLPDAARLRRGRVVEARPGAARVLFEDHEATKSWWLSLPGLLSTHDQSQHSYPLGTPVECLTDERGEAGVILGAVYSAANPPPLNDLGQILLQLAAGVKLLIDRTGPSLTLEVGPNRIEMGPAGITITAPRIEMNKA